MLFQDDLYSLVGIGLILIQDINRDNDNISKKLNKGFDILRWSINVAMYHITVLSLLYMLVI